MAELHAQDDASRPILRREVILPKPRHGLGFHRRVAVLSILVALMAGSLDAMLWREAQRRAERAQLEAEIAAERAALEVEQDLLCGNESHLRELE